MKKDLAAAYSAKRMKRGSPKAEATDTEDFLTADMDTPEPADNEDMFAQDEPDVGPADNMDNTSGNANLDSIMRKLRMSRMKG